MSSGDDFQIFISYARPDQEWAGELYEWLKRAGFNVWIDFMKLKPGQKWDYEISLALNKSSIVIVLLSYNSVDRRGYVQREIKSALEKLKEKLDDDIFIIPVLLDDDVSVPENLKSIQYIFASHSKVKEAIADAISHQIERLGGERRHLQDEKDLRWTSRLKHELWEGLPGYELELQVLNFTSDTYPMMNEMGDYIRGQMLEHLLTARGAKLAQEPDVYNFAQDQWMRTNKFDASCGDPFIKGKIVSVRYFLTWYLGGAAHESFGFQTFSFVLEPLVLISSIAQIFTEPSSAFPLFQARVRSELANLLAGPDMSMDPDIEWIDRGTSHWEDFMAFEFVDDGVRIFFSSYKVAAFAYGTPEVTVPYELIVKLMHREYVTALGIERLLWS